VYASANDDTLGIDSTKFFQLVAKGVLRARKLGKRIMIEGESLHDYVRSLPRAKIKPPNPRTTATGNGGSVGGLAAERVDSSAAQLEEAG
jgi:hypothetical protein